MYNAPFATPVLFTDAFPPERYCIVSMSAFWLRWPRPMKSKRRKMHRVRTIHNAKPTCRFLTYCPVKSRGLQGIVSPSFIDTEIKENSYAQAYVGGLYREQGMGPVNEWLRSLFQLYVQDVYENIRREYLLPPMRPPPPPTLRSIR